MNEIPGGAKIDYERTEDECKLIDIKFKIRKEDPSEGYKRLLSIKYMTKEQVQNRIIEIVSEFNELQGRLKQLIDLEVVEAAEAKVEEVKTQTPVQ